MKTVSIVLCSYNGEHFLKTQLDSIVCQTYPIHELIIQDDGSTDHTLDIAREYAAQYPFIRVEQHPQNLGFNRNFENALKKATGDFIAIADQDDIWYPEKSPNRYKPSVRTTSAFPAITPTPLIRKVK